MHRVRRLSPLALAPALAVAAAAAAAAGCQVGELDNGVGSSVHIPLTTSTQSGVYRLSATFEFAGPESISVDASGDEPFLEVTLSPGTYGLTLADGWTMERIDASGGATPVAAILASPPLQQIQVLPGVVSFAYYQFLLTGEGDSSVQISFGVADAASMIGTLTLYGGSGSDPATGPFAGSLNKPIITQIVFPPPAGQKQVGENGEPQLALSAQGAFVTFYDDPFMSGVFGPALGGSALGMVLTGGPVSDAQLQPVSFAIGGAAGDTNGATSLGVGEGIAQGNGVDPEGFPNLPGQMSIEGQVQVQVADPATGQLGEALGEIHLTYRSGPQQGNQ